MKHILVFALSLVFYISLSAQVDPVHWNFTLDKISDDEVILNMFAEMDDNWAIYSQHLGEDGPFPTTFTIINNEGEEINVLLDEPEGIEVYDEMFDMNIIKFKKHVIFSKVFKISELGDKVEGTVTYMTCDDTKCLPPNSRGFQFDLPQ